jgi:hypothetical protein
MPLKRPSRSAVFRAFVKTRRASPRPVASAARISSRHRVSSAPAVKSLSFVPKRSYAWRNWWMSQTTLFSCLTR